VRTQVKYLVIYRHKEKYSNGEMCRFYNNERIQTKTKLTPLEKRSQFVA